MKRLASLFAVLLLALPCYGQISFKGPAEGKSGRPYWIEAEVLGKDPQFQVFKDGEPFLGEFRKMRDLDGKIVLYLFDEVPGKFLIVGAVAVGEKVALTHYKLSTNGSKPEPEPKPTPEVSNFLEKLQLAFQKDPRQNKVLDLGTAIEEAIRADTKNYAALAAQIEKNSEKNGLKVDDIAAVQDEIATYVQSKLGQNPSGFDIEKARKIWQEVATTLRTLK